MITTIRPGPLTGSVSQCMSSFQRFLDMTIGFVFFFSFGTQQLDLYFFFFVVNNWICIDSESSTSININRDCQNSMTRRIGLICFVISNLSFFQLNQKKKGRKIEKFSNKKRKRTFGLKITKFQGNKN